MKTQLIAKIDAQRDDIIALHNKYLKLEPQQHTAHTWCDAFSDEVRDLLELDACDDICSDEQHMKAWQYIFTNLAQWVA